MSKWFLLVAISIQSANELSGGQVGRLYPEMEKGAFWLIMYVNRMALSAILRIATTTKGFL